MRLKYLKYNPNVLPAVVQVKSRKCHVAKTKEFQQEGKLRQNPLDLKSTGFASPASPSGTAPKHNRE